MSPNPSDIAGLVEPRFLLMKRGLYYRPDSNGYTGLKAEAGRYLESDAYPDGGVTAIHESDAEEFAPGCWQDVKIAHLERQIEKLVAERDEAREKNAAYFDEVTACYATIADERQALEAAQAKVGRYEAALKGVRADLLDENGLNRLSIVCTVWHSEIETTVDFIDAALERDARKARAEGGRS